MKTISRVLITVLVALAFSAGAGRVRASSEYAFVSPCNGDNVVISANAHQVGDGLVLSDATAVDMNTGAIYTVAYQYSVGGSRAFIVNLQLVGPNGGYHEHDLFLFDANGVATRVMENSSCS